MGFAVANTQSNMSVAEDEVINKEDVRRLPPPTFISDYGSNIDLAQVKSTVSYPIPTIGNLPPEVTLKRAAVESNSQIFVLFYSPTGVLGDATTTDFFKQKGIFVRGDPIPSHIAEKEALQSYIASSPETRNLVVVNGIEGVAVERDPLIGRPSYIILYTNHAMYTTAGDMPLADLTKIVESMDFNPK